MSAGVMRRLYRPRTEEQLRIMAWLLEQGVTRADVARAQLLADNRVRIVKTSGQCLEVEYRWGDVRVVQREEYGHVAKQRKGPARLGTGGGAAD